MKKEEILKSNRESLGKQYIIDFFGVQQSKLEKVDYIKKICMDAAKAANATIVDEKFFEFKPYGVSGAVIISESHIAIHTWPEYGYAAIDIFTCGPMDTDNALKHIKDNLNPNKFEIKEIKRGIMKDVIKKH